MNEPFNNVDPIGRRGLGKQEPIDSLRLDRNVVNQMSKTFVQGVSIRTISDLGYDYQPRMDHSNNKAAKVSQLYIKKKVPDMQEEMRRRT